MAAARSSLQKRNFSQIRQTRFFEQFGSGDRFVLNPVEENIVMSKTVEIYDTTLRDGTQGEHVNFSVEDKCRISEHLDSLGFDFIEGGYPGSNPRDEAFFERAKLLKLSNARLAAFG